MRKKIVFLLSFILIVSTLSGYGIGSAGAVNYESYHGFTTPETPVLPEHEAHPKLWFDESQIESVYKKKDADEYAATLWKSISSSIYLTMDFPEAPSCGTNGSQIHGYYGTMSRIAKYNAFMFIMEQDDVHKQRAIDALLRAYDGPIYTCQEIDPLVSGSPIDETYRAIWAQSYATAYDWIQPYLTEEEDQFVRERLAFEAQMMNDEVFRWGPRPHNHRSKPAWGLGSLALALSDHPNASEWLETGLKAANTNTKYFFSEDGVYREGSQYYIYSYINFVPFLYHYKNVSGVNHFPIFKPAFLWEFHASNNNGWLPNVEDSFLRHNYMLMVASQFMSDEYMTPLHSNAKWGNLFQWRYFNTDTQPWGGEFGNNTGASYEDTMDLDKYLTYDPTISHIKPTGTGTSFFDKGGQTIFRNNWNVNDPSSRYLLFHGVAEADNHNHFDHLSFIIHAENQMMASDSGYSRSSYGEEIRRSWYRTPETHNTVTLNGNWPVDFEENVTPPSNYNIDTAFFDYQQKKARFINIENDRTKGENPLLFPPDSESVGYINRSIAFPGQEYFVVADQLMTKGDKAGHFDLYLHGGRGMMSGDGNHRIWTYGNDNYGSSAKMAAWIFSNGANLTDHEGEVSYIKDDFDTFSYVKASEIGEKVNLLQVLIPLGITESVPEVVDLSNEQRVGGTVASNGNLDTFLVKQDQTMVSIKHVETDGTFGYVRENGKLLHWSIQEGTKLVHREQTIFESTAPVTMALDMSQRNSYSGQLYGTEDPYTISIKKPFGTNVKRVQINDREIEFNESESVVEFELSGEGNIVIEFEDEDEVDPSVPSQITDLDVVNQTDSSVTIEWSAPIVSTNSKNLGHYDVRYSTEPITVENWEKALPVTDEPLPETVNTKQSMIINGLRSSTKYYLAMKTISESFVESELSNVVEVETSYAQDMIAPGKVNDLKGEAIDEITASLTWTAPGDDDYYGTAESYDIRYSTTPITEENWEHAVSIVDKAPSPELVGTTQTVNVTGLLPGRTYYFAMKTIDHAGNESILSNLAFIAMQDSEEHPKITVQKVEASSHDGNVPENTIDGNLSTRWSANGEQEWILFDLGSIKKLEHLKLAWHSGQTRQTFFSIEVSIDHENWIPVHQHLSSSGLTEQLETYEMNGQYARYVKVIGHGNSSSGWNSMSEAEFYGKDASDLGNLLIGTQQLTNDKGEPITEIENTAFISAEFPVTNNQDKLANATVIAALYNEKGKLQQFTYITSGISPRETESFKFQVDIPKKKGQYELVIYAVEDVSDFSKLEKEFAKRR